MLGAAYDLVMSPLERRALGAQRAALVGRAGGRVLDVGAGTGANLAHYRSDLVQRVDMIEPDLSMGRRLLGRVADSPVPVEVHVVGIDAAEETFGAGVFDTVVCTLVLCTVPDLEAAIRTIRRLLTEDGRLLFLEHVAAVGALGAAQRVVRPAWKAAAGGCDLRRETTAALREAGFVIAAADRFHPIRGRARNSMWVAGEAYVPERNR